MIRKLIFGLVATVCISGQAYAQDGMFTRFYYGTEAVGVLGGGDASLKTVGGFAGASWSDGQIYGAVEGEAALGLGYEEDLGTEFEPKRTASLSVIAGVHATPDLVLFGRAGIEFAQLRSMRGGEVRTRGASGVRLGVGADYAFMPGFRVRAELGRSFLMDVDTEHMERTEFRLGLITQF